MWQGRSGVGGGSAVQQHDCSPLLPQLLYQPWSGVESQHGALLSQVDAAFSSHTLRMNVPKVKMIS